MILPPDSGASSADGAAAGSTLVASDRVITVAWPVMVCLCSDNFRHQAPWGISLSMSRHVLDRRRGRRVASCYVFTTALASVT